MKNVCCREGGGGDETNREKNANRKRGEKCTEKDFLIFIHSMESK